MRSAPRTVCCLLVLLLAIGPNLIVSQSVKTSDTDTSPGLADLTTNFCNQAPTTFTVQLPKLGHPPNEWSREGGVPEWHSSLPPVWGDREDEAFNDSVTIPNGRPIYALFVSGYSQNRYLDEVLFYNFARYLLAKGAYVHWAWWNNLLRPYMRRPLHHNQSYPGDLASDFANFTSPAQAENKAFPGDDYQFVADATLLLREIRANNPNAIIVVAGHSMGGAAIIHLVENMKRLNQNTLIDILAPIDPVGNRSYPFAGLRQNQDDFNWTRWRATNHNFKGYRSTRRTLQGCAVTGPWLKTWGQATAAIGCPKHIDSLDRVVIGENVVNLLHRYQTENLFPFDYEVKYSFIHDSTVGGTTRQTEVALKSDGADPGGWPQGGDRNKECCESGTNGKGWPADGHGEIVGHRGPSRPVPLSVRVKQSPQCGNECDDTGWPSRVLSNGTWSNPNSDDREIYLRNLETLALVDAWDYAPRNPNLCLVSGRLIYGNGPNGSTVEIDADVGSMIGLFERMNKPPTAVPSVTVEDCKAPVWQVSLDGTASVDTDETGTLQYKWTWSDGGQANGALVSASVPNGTSCFTLEVRDTSGHIDRKAVMPQCGVFRGKPSQ